MSGRRGRGHSDEHAPVGVTLALARGRAAAGLPVDVASIGADPAARATFEVALELGAPLVPVVDAMVEVERGRARLEAEVRRASAEGRAVAVGLVLGPPVLGMGTAALVTDDPVGTLATPVGRLLLLVAASLWTVGVALVVAAIRRVATAPAADDHVFTLAATAVRAGVPLSHALRRAALVPPARTRPAGERTPRGPPTTGAQPGREDPAALALWLDLAPGTDPPGSWGEVGRALASAQSTGIALAPVLDRLAAERREAAHARALERAARLGAVLTVPTALFLLPAGLLLAAGPLLLATLDQLMG